MFENKIDSSNSQREKNQFNFRTDLESERRDLLLLLKMIAYDKIKKIKITNIRL